ncbi:MAG: hypothetical protein ACLSVD_01965 [Eggerthellaceae bacterium]
MLVHMKPKKGERDVNWLLIKERTTTCARMPASTVRNVRANRAHHGRDRARGRRGVRREPFDHVDAELASW